jgi:hypothetical protein
MYADPAAQKQDYRTWVAAVESRAGHEDTVLFIDGPSYGLARRYEMEDSPVKIVNLRSSGNLEQRPAERVAEIAELAAEYPHLWLATAGNSLGEAETWLGQNAVSVDEPLGFQAITLRRYQSADSPTTLQAAEAAAEATFMCTAGTELCLAIGAPDRVPAGAVLPVALRWRPPANAWVSLRLVAEDGTVIAAADSPVPPQNPALSEWDGVGLTRIGLSVPDGASGQGRVEVHVYTPTGGEMGRFQGPRVILTEPDPGA